MKKLKEIFNGNAKGVYIVSILFVSILFVIVVTPSCLSDDKGWITIIGLLISFLGLIATIYYGEESRKNEQNNKEKTNNLDNGKRKNRYNIMMCVFILVLAAFAVALGYGLYENKKYQNQVAVEQQHLFRQHTKDFERFMQDSIGIENAYQKIAIGRSTLDQILEMLSLESSLSDTSSNDFINLYNSRVDDAIRTINDAIDDPRNIQRREESKRELGPQKDSIEKLRYIL